MIIGKGRNEKESELFNIPSFSTISYPESPFPEVENVPTEIFLKRITFTFVGYDAVTYLLEDLSQAGSTSHLEVLLSRGQAPRPHRARRLQG